MGDYQAVIGLEVHAQLKTRTKIFCPCEVVFGAPANSRVCPVCLGLPGSLPVPNREALRLAVRLAMALGCQLSRQSTWARKNYFYPDQPKGYQITQHERPLASGGSVRIEPEGEPVLELPLERIHLEEDAGKSVHEGLGAGISGVDHNRCGVPLVEIVTRPEIRSSRQAGLFLERLRSILRVSGVCDAEMEKGSLRCDANISVHRPGEPFGTRTEIKNLNSFRHLRRALEHEIKRQVSRLERGEGVRVETRLWDERAGQTVVMRSKEVAHDYRYFPDPDLPPLVLDDQLVASALEQMPELPHLRRDRFVTEYSLSDSHAHRLTCEPALADAFERVAEVVGSGPLVAKWILGEVIALQGEMELRIDQLPVGAEALADLLLLVQAGRVSGQAGKKVLRGMARTGRSCQQVVEEEGLAQICDEDQLEDLCCRVLEADAAKVALYHSGKRVLHGYFVGQVMRASHGRAHPEQVGKILLRLLGEGPR